MKLYVCLVLTFFVLVSCQNDALQTFDCSSGKCVEASVSDPGSTSWVVRVNDWMIYHDATTNFLGAACISSQYAVGYSESKDLMLIMCAETRSLIYITKRTAYLLDGCKVKMSFWTADEFSLTVTGVIEEVEALKKNDDDFDVREVLTYLYGHDDAPCKEKKGLSKRLQESFGGVFAKIKDGYRAKTIRVADYEAGFFEPVFTRSKRDMSVYKYLMSLTLTRIPVDARASGALYTALTTGDLEALQDQRFKYLFCKSMYASTQEALEGKLRVTYAEVVEKDQEYLILAGIDGDNFAIYIISRDGSAVMYLGYIGNHKVWYMGCQVSHYILVLPEGGPNFALYNRATGVGIVVCRKTGIALPVTKDSKLLIKDFLNYSLHDAVIRSSNIASSTKVTRRSSGSFIFESFIQNAHFLGNVLFLRSSLKTKQQLNKNFKVFLKEFWFIKDYDNKDGSSNVVLFFFKYVCLAGLKEDYRDLVNAVGINDSTMHCQDLILGTYDSTLYMYTQGYNGTISI